NEVKHHRHHHADKAVLLGESGKNEVRMGDRKEAELRLTPFGYAFAPRAAGAHRDFRLNELVSGTLRIAFRVEEADDPGFLIGLERREPDGKHDQSDRSDGQPVFPWHAREENADGEDRQIGEGRPEVRLFGDQRHRQQDHAGEFQQIVPFEGVGAQLRQETRDQENDHDFGEFRDLQMDTGRQRDPAGRSESPFADRENGDQQRDRCEIERPGMRHQGVIVDARRNPHEKYTGCDVEKLLPPGALPDGVVSRAEDLHDAEAADNHHDDEHRPVEVFQAGESEHGYLAASAAAGFSSAITFEGFALSYATLRGILLYATLRAAVCFAASASAMRAFLSKYALMTSRAVGAAYAPWTPTFSHNTATLISGFSQGA